MKNVFENHSGALVDIYDLKGSTVGRFTPACTEEKRRSLTDLFGRERAPASMQVKKDLNFMADNRNFSFGAASECSRFIDIVRKDTEYLKSLGVLDYSLLVGVRESGFWEAGIIDFLTPYSLRKKAEHLFVGGVKGRKVESGVSANLHPALIVTRIAADHLLCAPGAICRPFSRLRRDVCRCCFSDRGVVTDRERQFGLSQ